MDNRQAHALEIAADWADRLGNLTDAERRELAAWIAESKVHAQAFERMRQLLADAAVFEALETADRPAEALPSFPTIPNAARHRPRAQRAAPRLARRQAIAAGIAGALALPLAGYWALHRGEEDSAPSSPRLRYASGVGERRRLVLPDGSGLLLDAASAVAVHFTEGRRTITLDRGAARFDVRRDASRPFEVRTPLAVMMALGTSFSTDILSSASELRVFSGRVQLTVQDGASLVIPARQWALAQAGSLETGSFNPASHAGWPDDWLDADSMRLGFAVERLARYSATPLRLDDPELADLTFSGRFRLDTPEQSLALIGALFGLRAERRSGTIYLGRGRSG